MKAFLKAVRRALTGLNVPVLKQKLEASDDYEVMLLNVLEMINPTQLETSYKPSKGQAIVVEAHAHDLMEFSTRLSGMHSQMMMPDRPMLPTTINDKSIQINNLDNFLCSDGRDYIAIEVAVERFKLNATLLISHLILCRTEDFGSGNFNYRVTKPTVADIQEIALAVLKLQE